MMDAWTSLVRNGKVGQEIAIAHPSPDDGISPCPRLPQTGRALENAASRIASQLDVHRFPAVIDTCWAQFATARARRPIEHTAVSRRLADLRLRGPRRRAEYDESNMQLYSSREQFTLPIVFDLL